MKGSFEISNIGFVLPGCHGNNLASLRARLESGEPEFRISSGVRARGRLVGMVEDSTLERFLLAGESRLHAMALSTIASCEFPTLPAETLLVLGCMSGDDETAIHTATRNAVRRELRGSWKFPEVRTHAEQTTVSSLLPKLQRELGLSGVSLVVDSACASALTAVDVACQWLRLGYSQYAVVGGVEASLGDESFRLFDTLGVLAPEYSVPFADRSQGMVPAEGAVFFLLRAPSTGSSRGAVSISGLGASSNGEGASLFSPSTPGQCLAAQRLGSNPCDFVDAHATGTRVGDAAEAEALRLVTAEWATAPVVESSKSIFGHTKGTAGAVGMASAVSYLAANAASLRAGRARVHAAGFGGANYQVELSLAPGSERGAASESVSVESFSLIGRACCGTGVLAEEVIRGGFRLPPSALARIDPLEKAALLAVQSAFERSCLAPSAALRARTSVISASHTGTDTAELWAMATHLNPPETLAADSATSEWWKAVLQQAVELKQEVVGALNSCVSGRVASVFNFQGKNFHVDAGTRSQTVGRFLAGLEIASGDSDLVVVLLVEEEPSIVPLVTRNAVTCEIWASQAFAAGHGYPTLAVKSLGEMRGACD